MEGHRRYAEDPEPRWYPGQTPYESGAHERPDGAYRLPGQRPGDPEPVAPVSGYGDRYAYPSIDPLTSDPLTSGPLASGSSPSGAPAPAGFGSGWTGGPATTPGTGGPASEALRVPLGPTEYPPVRPAGTALPAEKPSAPAAAGVPAWAADPSAPATPRYDDPTGPVPPVGGRSGDVPEAARSGADRIAASRPPGGERVYRSRRPALAVVVGVVTALLMVPVIRLLAQVTFTGPPTAAGIVPAVLLTLGLPLTGVGLYGVAGAGRTVDQGGLLRPPTCYLLVGLVLLLSAGLATS